MMFFSQPLGTATEIRYLDVCYNIIIELELQLRCMTCCMHKFNFMVHVVWCPIPNIYTAQFEMHTVMLEILEYTKISRGLF